MSKLPTYKNKTEGEVFSFDLEESYILGYNVERLRTASHMSISTFMHVANISRPTLYKIERGEADLQMSVLKKLADALGVSMAELLTLPYNVKDPDHCRKSCQARALSRRERHSKRK